MNLEKLTPPNNKFTAFIIPALLVGTGIYFWGLILPYLLWMATNTIALAVCVAVLGIGWINRIGLRMWYLGFTSRVFGFLVKNDFLSVIEGHLIILRKKYKNLERIRIELEGKKKELERVIEDKSKEHKEYNRLAIAAKKMNDNNMALVNSRKANQLLTTINNYQAILAPYTKNTTLLAQLSELRKMSIETLTFTVDNKREEFKTVKKMVKGLRSISDLVDSNNPEAKIFGMSLLALEEEVTQDLAEIEDFENKAKPLINNMNISKQADDDEAMLYLENLMKKTLDNTDPNKYHKIAVDDFSKSHSVDYIPFEEIKNKYSI